jgi:hypothetical protein
MKRAWSAVSGSRMSSPALAIELQQHAMVLFKGTADYTGTISVDSYWQMVAVCACLEALCWQRSLQNDACLHPVHSTAAPSAVPKNVLTSTTACIKHSQQANRDEVYFCRISPAMYLRQYAQTALCKVCVTVKITGDSRNTNSPAAIGVADTKPRPDPGMSTVSIRTIKGSRVGLRQQLGSDSGTYSKNTLSPNLISPCGLKV